MMRTIVTLILFGILILYLVIGGLVFHRLEADHNQFDAYEYHIAVTSSVIVDRELLVRLNSVLQELTKQTDGHKSPVDSLNCTHSVVLDKEELRHLATDLQLAIDHNWNETTSVDNSSTIYGGWDIPESIFFAVTVVTTIGYGHLSPTTDREKAFCSIYAIIGIPLCFVVLINIGKRLKDFASRLDNCLTFRNRPRWFGKQLRSAIILLFGATVFLFIPSAIFCYLEEWTYATSLYFSLISLTTIGFGDHIAGMLYYGPYTTLYRLLVALWIFLGLSWLSCFLSSVQDSLQMLIKDIDDRPLISRINNKDRRGEAEESIEECQLINVEARGSSGSAGN